ncbi:hypothetical protein L917_12581 [Phytophthora nicotianae]|uniref:Uncharacterized protein n=1 Tax=Phytophthora nicotianae TaxID=4792 RepID=W2KT96_PHYNI|nr:hypothetical protein L917_12581 [Phytophthora nicotianae]
MQTHETQEMFGLALWDLLESGFERSQRTRSDAVADRGVDPRHYGDTVPKSND